MKRSHRSSTTPTSFFWASPTVTTNLPRTAIPITKEVSGPLDINEDRPLYALVQYGGDIENVDYQPLVDKIGKNLKILPGSTPGYRVGIRPMRTFHALTNSIHDKMKLMSRLGWRARRATHEIPKGPYCSHRGYRLLRGKVEIGEEGRIRRNAEGPVKLVPPWNRFLRWMILVWQKRQPTVSSRWPFGVTARRKVCLL